MNGLLIVFEGTDGSGKSTQLQLLAAHLSRRGLPVLTTREPTDGPYGQKIRALYSDRTACSPAEELALFLADRREHVRELLLPALAAGQIVLSDRYYLSTVAYQGARGMMPAEILAANSFAPPPDLALLFELSPQQGLARITEKRGEVPNAFEQLQELERVAAIFAGLDLPYVRRIAADGSVDAVHRLIRNEVEPLLQNHCHQLKARP